MILNEKLYNVFETKAENVDVEILSLGLGYTAVITSDGGMGIAYTYINGKAGCSVNSDDTDYEGAPAKALLSHIKSSNPIHRSMALALINALNYENALALPEDKGKKSAFFDVLGIKRGTRVAMVGFFKPMMSSFEAAGARVTVMDAAHGLGSRDEFYQMLKQDADVLVLTSTSILNSTTEEILLNANDAVKTVMLGPSTPMVAEAFDHLPVHILAGTVPLDREKLLKAIRHGAGTPVIQRSSRKAYLEIIRNEE